MDQIPHGEYRNPHTKVKGKKKKISTRFVFLLRIPFRHSKINTVSLPVQRNGAVLSGSVQKQGWDLRWVDVTGRCKLAHAALCP